MSTTKTTSAERTLGRRILIIGSPGAGKSTFAKWLAERLNIPIIHLDQLFWLPGWVKKDKTIFDAELKEALEQDSWIIDGNHRRSLPHRLAHADAVIWLDVPRVTCIYRIIKRMLLGVLCKTHQVDPRTNNKERLSWQLICYTWNFPNQKTEIHDYITHASNNVTFYKLDSPKQVNDFLMHI